MVGLYIGAAGAANRCNGSTSSASARLGSSERKFYCKRNILRAEGVGKAEIPVQTGRNKNADNGSKVDLYSGLAIADSIFVSLILLLSSSILLLLLLLVIKELLSLKGLGARF